MRATRATPGDPDRRSSGRLRHRSRQPPGADWLGLHHPGIIALDPPTLTFWDDEASLAAWAHRLATHKRQMDRYRTAGNADRASFTRLTALRSSGTWYGRDPVATARAHGSDGSDS